MQKERRIADGRMQRFIGTLLRVGVIAAACIAGAGGVFFLARHGGETPRYGVFRSEPAYLKSALDVVKAAVSLRSDAVIQLGILALILVPILRVAVSILAYAWERDWLYCGVTVFVLAILLFSLLSGVI